MDGNGEKTHDEHVQSGAEDGHDHAQERLMRQAADDGIPIAEAKNAGEQEIAGGGKKIQRG